MNNVRWFLLRAVAIILLACPALADVYRQGQEQLQNQSFSASSGSDAEVAANWRFWPEGTKGARVVGSTLEVSATISPMAGAYQRINLNGASAPTIRVDIETDGVLDVPNFDPASFHGGISAYAEFIMEDGRVLYGTYYPFYTTTKQCSTIELQGPSGRISHMFLVLGIIRGMGMVRFSNPSVKLFPSQPGAITFQVDDGKTSTFTEVYPRLNQAGLPGSVALVSSWIGRPGFVNRDHVRTLSYAGWDILSHSRTHEDLTALLSEKGEDAVRYEIVQSARELEAITGLPIYGFAHPFGAQNGRTVAIGLEEYDMMRDFFSSVNYSGLAPTMLHPIKILRTTTVSEMQAAVDAAKNGAWVLFVLHDVTAHPENEYDCTPAQLEMLIATVRSSGVKVLNCEDAASLFSSRALPKQRGRSIDSRSSIKRTIVNRWVEPWFRLPLTSGSGEKSPGSIVQN